LLGGEEGLDYIFRVLEQAPSKTRPGGASLVLEIDANQAQRVSDKAHAIYPGARIEILKDLASLDRAILIDQR
jgi:methylase of polypeptide subunit release factors